MDPERTLQLRIGVFTIVVFVALGAIVTSMNREGGLFTPRYTLLGEFDNIEGLFVNAPVLLAGNNVGRVKSIRFLEPGAEHAIEVGLDVDARVSERIRSDSIASIRMNGLLGDMYVEISLGSVDREELPPGGMLETMEPLSFAVLSDHGTDLLENLVALSSSADRIVGDFQESMGPQSIADTLGSLQRLVGEIENGDGPLHTLVYGDPNSSLLAELEEAAGRLDNLLAAIEEGPGLLHEVVYAESENSAPTLESMRHSAARLESILAKIDSGEGSLGLILNDPTLYEDIKLIVSGARDSALLRAMIGMIREEQTE